MHAQGHGGTLSKALRAATCVSVLTVMTIAVGGPSDARADGTGTRSSTQSSTPALSSAEWKPVAMTAPSFPLPRARSLTPLPFRRPYPDRGAPDGPYADPQDEWSFEFSFGDCTSGPGTRSLIGGLIGGVVGGLIAAGSDDATGQDSPDAAAVFASTMLGAAIGGSIGRMIELSDPACVGAALDRAESGQPIRWRADPEGPRYQLVPGETYQHHGRACRDAIVSIVDRSVVDSRYGAQTPPTEQASRSPIQYCRSPDGRWSPIL